MTLQPFYTPQDLKPAYQLRYNWTGWPSTPTMPPEPDEAFISSLSEQWETDGIRLLEHRWSSDEVHILASVKPSVAPIVFSARIKGRLQHALRKCETPVKFSRKLAMRTVGATKTDTVERYIENQAVNEPLADPRFNEFLKQFTVVQKAVDLTTPTKTSSGRYWYNLHLVLVIRDRFRLTGSQRLGALRDGALRVAEHKEHHISRLSVMPDHMHLAVRGHIETSPESIALDFMNNLAFLLRQEALWQPSYYIGTFGVYDMGAVRRVGPIAPQADSRAGASPPGSLKGVSVQAYSPAGRARRGLLE